MFGAHGKVDSRKGLLQGKELNTLLHGVQFSNKKVGLPFNSMPSWKILHLSSVFGTFIGYNMDCM